LFSLQGGDEARPGLGKVILMLLKHPGETLENKRALQALLEEWSRKIFASTKDYKQLPKTLREVAEGSNSIARHGKHSDIFNTCFAQTQTCAQILLPFLHNTR